MQPFSKFLKFSEFTQKLIKKCCSGDRVIDLLFHFPISIQNRTEDINRFSDNDKLTIVVKIIEHLMPHNKSSPYKVFGETSSGDIITILYFNYNAAFIRRLLPIDGVFTISGNAKGTTDGIHIVHPDIIASSNMLRYYIGIEPVYPLVSRLTNHSLQYAIGNLLKIMPEISDWIPEKFIHEYKLAKFADSIRTVHNPQRLEDISISTSFARKRIAIDELLANQIRLKQIRKSVRECNVPRISQTNSIIGRFQLPFELTEDQMSCLNDIKKDFISGKPMNRLIQGDVGSGKTVVAFMAMLIALENDWQVVLLAPTEILAIQHFNIIRQMSKNLGLNLDVMLSSNRRIRSSQIEKLKSGETQILIGTHAILEDNISFKSLGLVIIDEQHRFGVLQRMALVKKCEHPNILSMSATPIPRTILLGCYGDLDVSTIRTKPKGRNPTETIVVNASKIEDLVKRLKGLDSQIYWVCPVIEESESLVDVNTRCKYLGNHLDDVSLLHGKMKPKEKDDIINRFKNGEFKVLVSTTVIEVGIDIHNANIIVIEHAERFGLAQLHQLRGRVGRGSNDSYCVLLYHYPISGVGKRRLQLMKDTNDGFLLSEEDLRLRGTGDILGKEQSGFNPLRFSDFSDNFQLIQIAEKISQTINITSEDAKVFRKIFNRLDDHIDDFIPLT